MFFKLFIIFSVLNQIIALPESLNSNNNQAAIWIYNEYLDSCLSGESIFDNTITYDVCGNSKINKWYLDENDDNTIIRYAADTDKCISVIDDEIMLGNCDEDTVMYYNEKHKFIKNDDDMCLGAGDNKYDEYIKLNECNRSNEKLIWEISSRKPTKNGTTTIKKTTTTIKSTPTAKPVWIYNEYTDNCLYAPEFSNRIPTYEKCDNADNYQWYIINTKEGSYFKSKSNMDLCMRVTDNDHSKLVMGDCDENAILLYSKNYGTIESILEENLCLGNSISSSENSPYDISLYKVRNNVKFYDCEKEIYDDQVWAILDSNPNKKTITTTTKKNTKNTTSSKKTTSTKKTTTTTGSIPTVDPYAKPKFIYNGITNKCLYAQAKTNQPAVLKDCEDKSNFLWYISPYPKGYFFTDYNTNRCLSLANGKIIVGDCKENSIFEYDSEKGFILPFNTKNNCVGIGNGNSPYTGDISVRTCENKPYDGNPEHIINDQKWEIWDKNPMDTFNAKTRTVWIYNKKLNKCLLSGTKFNNRPIMNNCDNTVKSKWEIPVSGDLFFKSVEYGWCIANTVPSTGGLNMRFCKSEDILMRDSFSSNTIRPPYNGKLCMGILNTGSATETRLNMNTCNSNNNDQYWEIRTSYPGSTTTTKKTTTTVTPTPTVRADGKCGSKVNAICNKGECCSKHGYCGKTSEYCSDGCQGDFGRCEVGGRCGAKYFGNCLNEEECCSEWGFCGKTNDYCRGKCQKDYGICKN